MTNEQPATLPGYEHLYTGKVRDLYVPIDPVTGARRDDEVLLVASDRVSAYDYVIDTPIPDKGKVLTQLSLWWFDRLDGLENHLLSTDVPAAVAGRAVLVRRLEMLPVECIARAYLTGSALAEYRDAGTVSGVPLPTGLSDGSKLPVTIFTPTTKAPIGGHDEPMTITQVQGVVGIQVASRLDVLTRRILARGNEIAAGKGILIADTKVEFGIDRTRQDHTGGPLIVLADEVLTPDSSRFWPADQWKPGQPQPSFDKQFVRDWLTSPASGWDKDSGQAPPALPDEVVEQTRERYLEAYQRITGTALT
ncbi:MAG: phosphoribosylaminoimidazolesuccinocarboxamide synthase [Actinomycetales bacterium]|nr:phosphoribosylaminoimidazolesuccinocarboxamide synthase [Actinomycetales bacterium]